MNSSADIRQAFLDFFADKEHQVVASSPLVPGNDPTLLFTNAGMVQFKDVFTGQDKRSYARATSVQRCVRAGGKHNDLENVGYTARHHTFFEMLGNFSFGDYFKRDAIQHAWQFLTETCGLPAEKLWVTVYEEDQEAADIWLNELKVSPDRFTRIGDKPGGKPHESDNFWSMGDTGPCGPCTEIFFDHGADVAGGPPGTPEEDGDRYIEIWNLVFMQFDRNKAGEMTPLTKPSVDTGMGLERLAAVMQKVHSNYEIDLFQSLIKAVAKLTATDDLENDSLKVIADHIRSCAFLVVDGVIPSNEGRGYVLRRIIRRALRHGHKLGKNDPFFYALVAPLVAEMGEAYPELSKLQTRVEQVLQQEEERFAETLDKGMRIFEERTADLAKGATIAGDVLFLLYDTYGFPVDLTADIARERGLGADMEGFDAAMGEQRDRARAASHFEIDEGMAELADASSEFVGYDGLSNQSTITAIYRDGQAVETLNGGEKGMVILDATPFYGESGGQIGDAGLLSGTDGTCFEVQDTQKQGSAFIHIGVVREGGALSVGAEVNGEVDADLRSAIACHHSATHLLHSALREVLGEHVQQKGSLVTAERLRFDISHFEAIKPEELVAIEKMVNDKIRENLSVDTRIMAIDDAREAGAMALFGEKYGDEVRVLSMGEFSVELCGGTHISRTGDIGLLKIVSEGGVAAGVRRVEAVAGAEALSWIDANESRLSSIAEMLKGSREDVDGRVQQLLERSRKLEKELEQLKGKLASSQGSDLAEQAVDVAGIKVLAARLDGADPKGLRDTVDQLKNKLGTAAVLLAAVNGDKISLVAGVSNDTTDRLKAGDLLKMVAEQVGGKGGGRPDMAQGGGSQPENLDQAIASVMAWVSEQLA
ncbi:alanine--tRNA ligase [Solemya pervernicosa gill symbiont]|uniref:Alanine--tRNA ligase n=2 Tax=Gammaproteobacteria incertae sedis TaxID=118884 RepID=A0A1T2L8P2_9GAMM|nr:alanine--tRNA ligase [Candidatus Reidiella endopervernicosa]OOZ41465.1 alanine--tRNA ligase [Solemya pervernicosa gill symbiont]QKQ27340.1 alanine--tRNA ligase [Candidatus Reidiella endopervernicosa]